MRDHHRDGIVLIGDAFRSSCPATGAGVTRLLTDVQQLCLVHLPRWFASEGMSADKISSFYSDPVKQACDKHSAAAAERGRSLAMKKGLRWRLERGVLMLAGQLPIIRQLARRWHGQAALCNTPSQTMT
jgi:2-polyprenyl-6-methoxyphenol hydroxylase-like FAD-dependent oxidoreductase